MAHLVTSAVYEHNFLNGKGVKVVICLMRPGWLGRDSLHIQRAGSERTIEPRMRHNSRNQPRVPAFALILVLNDARQEILQVLAVLDVLDADVDALGNDAVSNALVDLRLSLSAQEDARRAHRHPQREGVTFHTRPVLPWYCLCGKRCETRVLMLGQPNWASSPCAGLHCP